MTSPDRTSPRRPRLALVGTTMAVVVAVAAVIAVDFARQASPPGPGARPDVQPTPSESVSTGPTATASSAPTRGQARGRRTVRVGSLNALGAGHASDRDWRERTRDLVRLIARHGLGTRTGGLSLLALQEFTPRQARVLRSLLRQRSMPVAVVTGGWDRAILADRRTWRVRRRGALPLPYGPGATRPNPAVVLEHRATGATVAAASVHLPALPRLKQPALMRERRATGLDLIARRAERWHDRGHAVLVLGDFNQRTVPAGVRSSLRTGWGGPTTPIIDWVLGSRDRWEWKQQRVDRRTRLRDISDHLLVLQTLRLPRSR